MPGGTILGKCASCCGPLVCESLEGIGNLRGWSKADNWNAGSLSERKFTRVDLEVSPETLLCGAAYEGTFANHECDADPPCTEIVNEFTNLVARWDVEANAIAEEFAWIRTVCGETVGTTTWATNDPSGGGIHNYLYCLLGGYGGSLGGLVTSYPDDLSKRTDQPSSSGTCFTGPHEPPWNACCGSGTWGAQLRKEGQPARYGIESLSQADSLVAALLRERSFTASSGNDKITKSSHGFVTGDKLKYMGGAGFGGLTPDAFYWAIWDSSATFRVAASAADAMAGIYIDITSDGTAGGFVKVGALCWTHLVSAGSTLRLSRSQLPFQGRTVEVVRTFSGLSVGVEHVFTVTLRRFEPDDTLATLTGDPDEEVDVYFIPDTASGEHRYELPVEADADVLAVAITPVSLSP